MKEPDKRIHKLEDHIRSNLNQTTNQSISDHSFYSYRHANRLFTASKGESIHSYINKLRLQMALEYLLYTSDSIAAIAFAVGYESSAAFSKAFKKLFEQSPTDYRKANKAALPVEHKYDQEPFYSIEYLEAYNVLNKKVSLPSTFTYDTFFDTVKSAISDFASEATAWMLLWDEDPELALVADSRFYIGVDSNQASNQQQCEADISIKGRYAIFKPKTFQNQPYEHWQHLACLILDLHGKTLRDNFYIEYFSSSSLASMDLFRPKKIAIPIV